MCECVLGYLFSGIELYIYAVAVPCRTVLYVGTHNSDSKKGMVNSLDHTAFFKA